MTYYISYIMVSYIIHHGIISHTLYHHISSYVIVNSELRGLCSKRKVVEWVIDKIFASLKSKKWSEARMY